MYNALEAVHADLKGLENTLRTPAAAARVARIAEALEQCAQDVSDATRQATGEDDRAALQKVYRGMVAARRIVLRLHELSGMDQSSLQ
ncbi:MAG: type III secretion system protein [Pseudomonadota bacterium]|jgi:hypothetical protein|uniref:type III secretion system protein n=1 Tax=Burkholderiaceae TaxID=119060 RepID=UPI0010F542C5|nr:type III secretion system protein [Burkholderia sp. 4M9327F10]